MSQHPTTASASAAWSTVEEAAVAIHGGKGDLNRLGQLIRGLFSLGLGGLVEPVVGTIDISGGAWESQREGILAEARKLASGKLTWASRGELFANNLKVLTPDNPSLAGLAEVWREQADRYELFRANDGNFQVVDRGAAHFFAGCMGGLLDHRALTRHWPYECKNLEVIRPVVFDGAGYGWLMGRVLESTYRTFLNYSCAVYVVEPDAASMCILLHLQDLRPWRHRLRFFAGPEAQRKFDEALLEHRDWMLPGVAMGERLRVRAPVQIRESVARVAEARQTRDELLKAEIRGHYDGMTIGDWSARYDAAVAGGKPLKVLGITTRYSTVLQYSMDELGDAVRAAGHEFVLVKEADDQTAELPDLRLMAEHKPDLIVLLSHMRYENPRLPMNVPFLCWDQDSLPCMRTEAAGASLDALTYVAGSGAFWGYENLDWPRLNCIFSLPAGASHRYSNEAVSDEQMGKRRCAFSYTSNASGLPEALLAEVLAGYGEQLPMRRIVERAAAKVLRRANEGYAWDTARLGQMLDDVIEAEAPGLETAARSELIYQLRRYSDRVFRHVTLEWVARYCRRKNLSLRLYGKGWEHHPRLAEFAAGFLAPGEDMRAVYQASDINLQIIETGFIHSRVLDGLAAGGFFLYRLAPEASDINNTAQGRLAMARRAVESGCVTFAQLDASRDPLIVDAWKIARPNIQVGKPQERCRMLDFWLAAPTEDILIPCLNEITFSGEEQFAAMADRFLGDEKLRRSVASKFRQTVVDRFSYDARWREFLAGITSGLRSAAEEGALAKAA